MRRGIGSDIVRCRTDRADARFPTAWAKPGCPEATHSEIVNPYASDPLSDEPKIAL